MRQTFSGANRGWLAFIGLVLLIAGLLGILISTGLFLRLATAVGLDFDRPAPTSHIIGSATTSFFAMTVVVVGVLIVGVILGVLGLVWLLAQIPRTNEAKPFRMHDDAVLGLTVVEPSVLTGAVENDVETLDGVNDASAVLRGTAAQPELTIKLSANDRTDIQRLLHQIRTQIAGNLATAMEVPLRRLAVQVDITNVKQTSDNVTL